jgi:hypothetical protein
MPEKSIMPTRDQIAKRPAARRSGWTTAIFLASLAVLVGSAVADAQTGIKKTNKRPAPTEVEAPADYTSAHFLLHTDMTSKEAQELLKRLETMLDLISKYWGRPPVGLIECYVVKDLDKWPLDALDPHGRAKIEEGAGVTLTRSASMTVAGTKHVLAKSVVYAVADHGTPQHEAVHAYCGQNFGTAGPIWYAEGMAEMGQYWRPNDAAVHIHPGVLEYLQNSTPQTLRDIVDTRNRSYTGDSWQNYAWRWALCHLLANNTNYRERFRPLGLGLLSEEKVSFEQTYGAMADEISFEYLFFVRHLDQGYRVDLCSWDWKKKFKPLAGATPISARVVADHGWQPSGVTCVIDQQYDFAAQGSWQTSKTAHETSGDGERGGAGRLVGVLMQDYKLGKPFDLGSYGTFTAPGDGKLYLRCQDKWNELADNKGAMTVKLKLGGKGNSLSRPKEKTPAAANSETKTGASGSPGEKKVAAPAPGPDAADN